MKKVLTLLLAVMMLASVGLASAEETKEITFQDIPWGSNAETVWQTIVEKEYINLEMTEQNRMLHCSEGTATHLIPHESASKQFMMNVVPDNGEAYKAVQCRIGFNSAEVLQKIAGYEVDSLQFSFAENREETKLLCVQIALKAPRIDEVYSDLVSKLSSIYGESKHGDFGGIMYNDVWYGDNNTIVMLYFDSAYLNVYYGTLDAKNTLEESLTNFSNGVDNSDTSGL